MNESKRAQATMVAMVIKTSGEIVAQQMLSHTGNLAMAALIVRSALAELELNIYVRGDEQIVEDYKMMRDALQKSLESTTASTLAKAQNVVTSTGGAA